MGNKDKRSKAIAVNSKKRFKKHSGTTGHLESSVKQNLDVVQKDEVGVVVQTEESKNKVQIYTDKVSSKPIKRMRTRL